MASENSSYPISRIRMVGFVQQIAWSFQVLFLVRGFESFEVSLTWQLVLKLDESNEEKQRFVKNIGI